MASRTPVTPSLLMQAFGIPAQRATRWAAVVEEGVQLAGITLDTQLEDFLAQIGHESGCLLYTRELWGPTSAQVRYERNFEAPWPESPAQSRLPAFRVNRLAYTLGNVKAGDGKRYMGRGLIQTTGLTNTIKVTERLKDLVGAHAPDFVTAPRLLEDPVWASLSAGQFWRDKKLSTWAEKDDDRAVTLRVNGGYNGLAHRQALLLASRTAIRKANEQ